MAKKYYYIYKVGAGVEIGTNPDGQEVERAFNNLVSEMSGAGWRVLELVYGDRLEGTYAVMMKSGDNGLVSEIACYQIESVTTVN